MCPEGTDKQSAAAVAPAPLGAGGLDGGLLEELEATCIRAAELAGAVAWSHFERPHVVTQKGGVKNADIVTDADLAAQAAAFDAIRERFPSHAIIGEEGVPRGAVATELMWLVDPIDGTKNFAAGAIEFGVEVAALHRGVPVAGAIWTPWVNSRGHRVAHARAGGGAKLDGAPLRLRDNDGGVPGRDRHAILSSNFTRMYSCAPELAANMGDIRMVGSVSWEVVSLLTNVAQYIVTGVCHSWDFGAALILLREAGAATLTNTADGRLGHLGGWRADDYREDAETLRAVAAWTGVLVTAAPQTGRFLQANLRINSAKNPRRLTN